MTNTNRARFSVPYDIGPIADASLTCPICRAGDLETASEDEGRRLVKCLDCGVRFVYPPPPLPSIFAHFQDSPALDEEGARNTFEHNRENVLSRVAAHIRSQKETGKILDVGCATGFFLKRFFSVPGWQMWGVELSSASAGVAKQRGISVHKGTIHSAGFQSDFFEVITVLDAFYYFPRPQTDLAELHRILSSDGLLVIELPLSGSRIWRTTGKLGKLLSGVRFPLLRTSDHLFFYNPKSMSLLLSSQGFRIRTVVQLPGNRQRRLLRNVIYGCYSLFSSLLSFISGSNIMLGPRFLIVAQKIDLAVPSEAAGTLRNSEDCQTINNSI